MLCSFPWILLTLTVILSGPRSSVLLLVSDRFFFFGQIHSSWSQSRWQKEQGKIWKARSTQWFWMAWVHQWSTLLLEEKYVHLCIFFFSAALVGWFWFFPSQMNSMLFMPSYKAQHYCNKTASKWISVRTMLSLILQKQKRNFDTYNGKVFT